MPLVKPPKSGGYATNTQYYPDGQIKAFTFGNGVVHNKQLNAHKLPQLITDSKNDISQLDYSYAYDNQGNIKSQTDRI